MSIRLMTIVVLSLSAVLSTAAQQSTARVEPPRTARIEIHAFETTTLSDEQFLTEVKEGTPARISGELRLPQGTGRFPAVILVHGSGGVGANIELWAEELNGIGAAAFILDSFTGRGIVNTITDQSQLGNLTTIVDAYRALDLLSKHSRIDPSRIAVMGFSRGGLTALYSSLKRFQQMHGPQNIEFAAYIPFYPPCETRFIDDEKLSKRPVRIFHGAADDWVQVEPCQRYVKRLRRAGNDVQLFIYPGARHVFDNPLFQPERRFPDAEVLTGCRREERAGGKLFNLDTQKPFTSQDACVTRGATVAFDLNAYSETLKAVKSFVTETLKPGNAVSP